MKCPTDNATLVMSERAGIEIDYCPECRGVWLDRGELDKILERATADGPPAPAPTQAPPQQYSEPRYEQPRYDSRHQQPYRKKKKEHWLSEIFD
ncbi:zf-TFIIB domain-containing protein [Aeromicrobium sp. NPDC092404]|uniref:TFIIB-type zinc ribbon-containing protein n=1 Tax=Aeromicrobium sp. NPDC092404 TaxID=3154976 RepID=UPI0034265DD7